MKDEITKLQQEEEKILKQLELSPLKNFIFTDYNKDKKE